MKHNKRLTALLAGMLAVSMLFTGCGGSNSGASDTGLIDGTYEGTGAGYGGNIKLALPHRRGRKDHQGRGAGSTARPLASAIRPWSRSRLPSWKSRELRESKP